MIMLHYYGMRELSVCGIIIDVAVMRFELVHIMTDYFSDKFVEFLHKLNFSKVIASLNNIICRGRVDMEYKTNVMRILDKMKIEYKCHNYANTNAVSGIEVADVLNQNPEQVFKTLVTIGKSKKYYVFLIPVAEELDLKKAADSVHEKSIEMIKAKDLLSVTGYIHGGCSPIGMKKNFITSIDNSAINFGTIIFSAGKIGYQIEIGLEELKKVIQFNLSDIISFASRPASKTS